MPPAPRSPGQERAPRRLDREARPRLVVRFRDDLRLPAEAFRLGEFAREMHLDRDALGELADLPIQPGAAGLSVDRLVSLMARARALSRDYRPPNLANFRRVDAESRDHGQRLAEALQALPVVDYAYLHPGPVTPPSPGVQASNDPLAPQQGYLDAAPVGIDARYAWQLAGGNGSGQRLVDIEWGWGTQHADLAGQPIQVIHAPLQDYHEHGTNVLGVIAAADNNLLCVGIVPHLDGIGLVGQWWGPDQYETDEAMLLALSEMDEGDVLLLEAQTNMFGYTEIPLEAEPAVYEYCKLARASHITVVAAAGNGGHDLDKITDDQGVRIFDRAVRDSGAILVGAAEPMSQPPHLPHKYTCHGSRVDCFAWGTDVYSLSLGNTGTTWPRGLTFSAIPRRRPPSWPARHLRCRAARAPGRPTRATCCRPTCASGCRAGTPATPIPPTRPTTTSA